MRIGELAERTGASIRSLRYYEERGLISAHRSPSGQRYFEDSAVPRVLLISDLLAAGLGTRAIAEVLPCLSQPAVRTSALTARLIEERDRLADDIHQRQRMHEALQRIIDNAPPMEQ